MTIEEIMDILDWFDDSLYDYLAHSMLSKLDAEARIERALPSLRRYAQELLNQHRGTEIEYPEYAQRIPA